MYVYGGPGSQTVKNTWGYGNFLWYQMMAQKGYIIVSVDNRGTGARGEAFKKCTYEQLGKIEAEDQIAAAKQIAQYSYIDKNLDKKEQLKFMQEIIYNYDLSYLEDAMEQEDWNGFHELTKKSNRCLIVGDDFIATQISRLKRTIRLKAINAVIVKPHQNGSLIGLKKIFDICKKHKIKTIMSHRSGETLDSALADLAFGFQADFIKCGVFGKEREAKLERMMEIEKNL
jgi:enolase